MTLLAASSNVIPKAPKRSTTALRTGIEFSPIPAVKTIASTPPKYTK